MQSASADSSCSVHGPYANNLSQTVTLLKSLSDDSSSPAEQFVPRIHGTYVFSHAQLMNLFHNLIMSSISDQTLEYLKVFPHRR
eukprot:11615928-Heterocapsa_arctica.AAC.1